MAAFLDDDLSFFLADSLSVPMNTFNNDMSTLLSDQQSFTSHHLMSSHESLQEILLPAPRIQYETSSLYQSCCSMQLPCSSTTGFSIAAKPELISSPPPAMASDLVISTGDRYQHEELNPQTEKKRKNNISIKREGENEVEKQSNKRYRKRQKKVAEAATSTGYVHVRARRGEATDSHSLAERVRRQKISARMKLLQSLVPGCDQLTGKALILDEIIKYVRALQTQVQYLADKLASVNPMLNKGLGSNFIDPADKLPLNQNGNNILQSSMDNSKIQGSAKQFGLDDLCSFW